MHHPAKIAGFNQKTAGMTAMTGSAIQLLLVSQ